MTATVFPTPHALMQYDLNISSQEVESISPPPWIWMGLVTALTEHGRSDTVPVPSTALYWPGSFCILPLRSRSPCKNSNHHETTLLWSPSYAGETLQDEMPRGRKERLRSTEAPDVDEEAILEVDISPAMRWITQLSPSKIPDPQNHELNKMVVLRP